MPLNDTKIRKSKVKTNRLYDNHGLYIQANNSKTKYRYWRLKYYRPSDHKEDVLALGTYPEISLSEARKKTAEARTLIAQGIDPKQHQRAANATLKNALRKTFESVAAETIKNQQLSDSTRLKKISRLETYVFPKIGKKPIDQISTQELVEIIRELVRERTFDTAKKVRRELNQVFIHATQVGYVNTNNAQNLQGLIPPHPVKHQPAITTPEKFGQLLKDINTYNKNSVVGAALRLAPLVFQRPGELVSMEWSDIDFDKNLWEIPPEKKKERKYLLGAHIVPLSTQAKNIIESLKTITGTQRFVFNSSQAQNKHISTDAVVKALRALGYNTKSEQSVHGFRASARTMIEEQLQVPYTIIELQLSHSVRDPLGQAYNRTKFLDERAKMMQEWSDYCDKLKDR